MGLGTISICMEWLQFVPWSLWGVWQVHSHKPWARHIVMPNSNTEFKWKMSCLLPVNNVKMWNNFKPIKGTLVITSQVYKLFLFFSDGIYNNIRENSLWLKCKIIYMYTYGILAHQIHQDNHLLHHTASGLECTVHRHSETFLLSKWMDEMLHLHNQLHLTHQYSLDLHHISSDLECTADFHKWTGLNCTFWKLALRVKNWQKLVRYNTCMWPSHLEYVIYLNWCSRNQFAKLYSQL